VDDQAAALIAERAAFAVPTMAIIFALLEEGPKLGLPSVSMEKLRRISDHALSGLTILKRAGARMGFGTDLLGPQHVRQSTEFTLRAQVLPPIDILRSVTTVNAQILNQAGRLGCVREGALADLLVVDGEPLSNVSVLSDPENLCVIMKDGEFHKRTI
jgi:imidazolonepropionase-like amidohydrolase